MPLNIDIYRGSEAKKYLNDDELDKLTELWMNETYRPVGASIFETRHSACSVLGIKQNEEEERAFFLKQIKRNLQEAIDRGDMLIARKGDKIIGMVRVYKLDKVAPNKFVRGDVYEIGKALVVPDERGQGVYRELRKQMITHVREKYGDISIIAATKNEGVKKLSREDDWIEIGVDNYLKIHGAPDDYIDSQREDSQLDGWTAFLCLPKEK